MHFAFVFHKIRTILWTSFYRIFGRLIFTKIGKGCVFEGWIDIPQRSGEIQLGDRVRICRLVELSVPRGGNLILGDDALLSRGVLISAHKLIQVGAHSMMAEYVVVHDNNHNFEDAETPIRLQGMTADEIFIGPDCWICAGASILKGARLGAGSIVAAGAVVNKPFNDSDIIAGVPAKVIGSR